MAETSLSVKEVKHARFVAHFIVCLNATEAALKAGYSKRSAYSTGSALLKDPEVADAVRRGLEDRGKRIEITQDGVVFELARIGFANMKDFIDPETGLPVADFRTIPRDQMAAVQSVTVENFRLRDGGQRTKTTFKLNDKRAALELIGKHLGMFGRELTQSGGIDLANMTKTEANARLLELETKLAEDDDDVEM